MRVRDLFSLPDHPDTPEEHICSAALEGDIETTKALVAKGVDIESLDSLGKTPLMYASAHGHVELARYLLERGAQPNRQGPGGATSLHLAVDASIEVAKDVFDGEGRYEEPQTEMILLLMSLGADPEIVDASGHTPIDWARRAGARPAAGLLRALSRPDSHT